MSSIHEGTSEMKCMRRNIQEEAHNEKSHRRGYRQKGMPQQVVGTTRRVPYIWRHQRPDRHTEKGTYQWEYMEVSSMKAHQHTLKPVLDLQVENIRRGIEENTRRRGRTYEVWGK